MEDKKDIAKRPKTGGRVKGTANKVTTATRECISELLADYQQSGLMASDFIKLEPKDRIMIAEKMMQYCIPKMASISADINVTETKITIEQKLRERSIEVEE